VVTTAAVSVEPPPVPKQQKRSQYEIETFTGWLLRQEQIGVIDAELTIVLSSISVACKQIASLVQRAGISNLTGLQGASNIQGEDQKKLDVISNEVLLLLSLSLSLSLSPLVGQNTTQFPQ
jgi:fructose-1,6-bisphosphatase I